MHNYNLPKKLLILIVLYLLFSLNIFSNPIEIDKNYNKDITKESYIYIDKKLNTSINYIKSKVKNNDKIKFIKNQNDYIYYRGKYKLWIKFTIKNSTNKKLKKIINYHGQYTTKIYFYDGNNEIKIEGLLYKNQKRVTTTPYFEIKLNPNEIKTYYIEVYTLVTPINTKIKILDKETFYKNDIENKFILGLIYGVLIGFILYLIIMLNFSKNIAYLYYLIYILSISIISTIYRGISNIYIFDNIMMKYIYEFIPGLLIIHLIGICLFYSNYTYSKKLKKIQTILIIISTLILILQLIIDINTVYTIILISIILFTSLIYIVYYAICDKDINNIKYLIVLSNAIILIAHIIVLLELSGIFYIENILSLYIIETLFILDSFILLVILSYDIKSFQEDKIKLQKSLIKQKLEEKKLLEKEIKETKILIKEINHRVKNNIQMIMSMINLQERSVNNKITKSILKTLKSRINSIVKVYELLYNKNDLYYLNTSSYFLILIEELKQNYQSNIDINVNIQANIPLEQSIYSGIIINELISNSFKHAFTNKIKNDKKINISLENINNKFILIYKDNGKGYQQNEGSNSMGLVLIHTLVKSQLKGNIKTDSQNKVEVTISWKNYQEDTEIEKHNYKIK